MNMMIGVFVRGYAAGFRGIASANFFENPLTERQSLSAHQAAKPRSPKRVPYGKASKI
jgi:hypothetical protein